MSYYDYDEPYYESSIADEILSEYQEKMKGALKESIKLDIENIKKENERLKKVNEELRKMERDILNRECQLEHQKQDLMRQVRKERLSKLMEDFEVVMHKADTTYVKGEKCEKCDVDRRIHFKSPTGKDCTEVCECDISYRVFEPNEYYLIEFQINTSNGKMSTWFQEHKERDYDYYRSSYYADIVYKDGMKFEDLDRSKTFFRTKEECQKYCDWLNSTSKEEKINTNRSKSK